MGLRSRAPLARDHLPPLPRKVANPSPSQPPTLKVLSKWLKSIFVSLIDSQVKATYGTVVVY